MGSGYYITDDENGFGRVLVLKGPWCDEFAQVMQQQGVTVLRMSTSAGWKESAIEFLPRLTFLQGVEIYSENVRALNPLLEMSYLRLLQLDHIRSKFDFSSFKALEVCQISWKKNWKGIEHCTNLGFLNISSYPHDDLTWLSPLKKLEKLYLMGRKLRTLRGIDAFLDLQELDIAYCTSLTDIFTLAKCKKLKKLDVNSCKKLAAIPDSLVLKNVEEVHFDNCGKIASLAPLAHWRSLQTLSCVDDTNIVDGNLDFLLQLPSLRKVRFGGRAHYSVNTDYLNNELKRKWVRA